MKDAQCKIRFPNEWSRNSRTEDTGLSHSRRRSRTSKTLIRDWFIPVTSTKTTNKKYHRGTFPFLLHSSFLRLLSVCSTCENSTCFSTYIYVHSSKHVQDDDLLQRIYDTNFEQHVCTYVWICGKSKENIVSLL